MRQVLCPVLVGREAHLAEIAAGVAAAGDGRGGAILVSGAAGVGKSRLVAEAAAAAASRGVPVLLGRAVQGRTPDPYRPITEALMSVLRTTGPPATPELAPFRSALGRVVPDWWEPGGAAESAAVLGEGVLRLVAALSRGAGVLLVLEDLHWAAPETVQTLEYVVDNVREQPVFCLATLRDEERGGALDAVGALVRRRNAALMDVGRLSAEQVAEMTRRCLDVTDLPDGVGTLVDRAEGSPLLVEELLAAAVSAGVLRHGPDGWSCREPRARVVPATLADVVEQRLAALGEPDREVLAAASLLGRRFDWTLLGPALRRDDRDVLESLRRAADAQLVVLEADDFRFRHALTCDAVAARLVGPERTRLAGAALRAIESARPGLPGPWCEIAATLTELAGDPVAAAGLLRRAGARALQRGTLGTARALLVRAAELLVDGGGPGAHDALSADVDTLLLQTAAVAGDVAHAVDVGQRLLQTLTRLDAPAPRRAAVHVRLATAAVAATDWALAGSHIVAAGDPPDRALRARIGAAAATVALGEGRLDDATELAGAALDAGRGVGDAEIVCSALEVLGRAARLRDVDRARAVFAEQSAVAEGSGLTLWRIRALQQLGTLELMTETRFDRLRAAHELAQASGALALAATVDLQIAGNLSASFETTESLVVAQRCVDVARRWKLGVLLPDALVVVARAHAIAGRDAEMAAALDEATVTGAGDPDVAAAVLGCRALYSLLVENRARAAAELAEAMALVRARPTATQRPFFGLAALVATLEAPPGDDARAAARAATATGVGVIEGLIRYGDAVALGRAGDTDGASRAFLAAEARLAPSEDRFAGYHQLGRRLVAEAALADGWGDPVGWLAEAARFFHGRGQVHVELACRSLLRRSGARVPRRSYGHSAVSARLAGMGVTDREAEVGALVGRGLTSRDVGRLLFISPRTVDKHVQRLMAKTRTAARSDLGPLFDG